MGAKTTDWIIKLVDKITAPVKKVTQGINSYLSTIKKSTAANHAYESSLSGIGSSLKSLAVGVGFVALTNQSMAFEHEMAKSNTIMKLSQVEFSGVTDEVKELSKQIPIARDQLSSGLYEVLSAGVPKENALQFLADASRAAVGGSAELPTLIRSTTTAVKAFNMEFDQAGLIQDKLQRSVDIGSMSMNELAEALPKAAIGASQMGVGIDELLGGFATLSGVTGSASEVGTQLNAILTSMMKPTAEAVEQAEALGIAFNAQSIRGAGGLGAYLDQLLPKIRAYSAQSGVGQEEIIARLFGREEAIRGILGVTGNLADSWKQNTVSINASAGSVASAFATMSETTQSKVQVMKSDLLSMFDELYAMGMPVIIALAQGIIGTLNWLFRFPEANPILAAVIASIAALTMAVWAYNSATIWATTSWTALTAAWKSSALQQVIGMIVTLGAMLLGLQAPMWAATSSTWALNVALYANPLMWIVALIAIVIGAVIALIVYWDDLKNTIYKFGKFLWDNSPFGWLMWLIDKIIPGVKKAWDDLFDFIFKSVDSTVTAIKNAIGWMKDLIGLSEEATEKVAAVQNAARPVGNIDGSGGEVERGAVSMKATGATVISAKPATSIAPKAEKVDTANSSKAIINFRNDFKIQISEATTNAKELAKLVVREITDQLSDAVITQAQ